MCEMNSVSFTGTLSCLSFDWDSKIISLDYSYIPKWETGSSNQDLQRREAKFCSVTLSWPLTSGYKRGRDVWEKNQEFGKRICLGKVRLCVSYFTPLCTFSSTNIEETLLSQGKRGDLRGSFTELAPWILYIYNICLQKKSSGERLTGPACGSWGQHYLGGDVLSLMVGQKFLSAGAQMKFICDSSTSLELF